MRYVGNENYRGRVEKIFWRKEEIEVMDFVLRRYEKVGKYRV